MKTFAIGLVLSLLAIAYCEDCSSAIDSFRKCRQDYRDQQEAKRPDPTKRQNDIKACYKQNNCKEPTFDSKSSEKQGNANREAVQKCHKDIGQKAHEAVKSCIEKKTGVKLPSKQDNGGGKEKGRRGGRGKGGDHEDVKTLCPTEQQRNDTRKCLRNLNKDAKGDRQQEAEQRFNDNCANKRSCFSKLSPTCQKKFNDTKTAACDCAKSELGSKKDDYEKQSEACNANAPHKGGSPRPNKEGGAQKESFVDRAIERACSNTQDPCDKPFQEREHKQWSGKGKEKGRH